MRDAGAETERKEKALRYSRAIMEALENPETLKDETLKAFVEEVKRRAEVRGNG